MTPQSWQRMRELFDLARERPPEERASFLDGACGDDRSLRAEVDALLASDAETSQFLETPVADGAAALDEVTAGPVGRLPIDGGGLDVGQPDTLREAIPGYKILKELHRGGQGVVYQAVQASTKRKVALKVMLEGPFSGAVSKRRFEREIELVGSLQHPGIVPIFDSGVASGRFYFAMEYIRGASLAQYVRGRELSIDDTLRLFAEVCRAIDHAHQKGVIHRDLKPSNVLVDDDGHPHVVDFGLAKVGGAGATDERSLLMSVTGQVMGTVAYMSPEQAAGRPDQVDMRSDVYALGVVLYELLTGQLPYELSGQISDNLTAIQKTAPRRPSTISHRINDEVETIILKALSKEKPRRYDTAGALGRDIERFLAGDPIEAKRDSAFYLLKKTLRRYRLPVAIAASFVVVIAAGLVASFVLWRKAVGESATATIERNRAVALATEKEALAAQEREAREDAEMNVYLALISSAGNALAAGDLAAANQHVDACVPDDPTQDRRGWEWYYLASLPRTERTVARGHGGIVWTGTFSPDGTRLATYSDDSTIRVWDAATGAPVCTIRPAGDEGPQRFSWPAMSWSPDGSRLAWAGAGETVRIADAATGKTLMRLEGHTDTVASVQWSPDGRHIASASLDRTARIWDSVTGRPVATFTAQPAAGSDVQHDAAPWFGLSSKVAWSHDDRHLAWSGGGVVSVYDWQRGKEISRRPIGAWGGVRWSPTADLLAYGDDQTTHWWSPLDDSSKRIERDTASIAGLDWSPDGAHVATIDKPEGTVHIFDVQTGEQTRQFAPGHEGAGRAVAWSPDGSKLASAGSEGSIRVWDPALSHSRPVNVLRGHVGPIRWLGWNPAGTGLASCGDDRTVRFWKLDPGRPNPVVIGAPEIIVDLSWSPDGTRVVTAAKQTGMKEVPIRVWDVASGLAVGPVRMGGASVGWSPDGRTIASGVDRWRLRLWDADAPTRAALYTQDRASRPEQRPPEPIRTSHVHWSPDGTRLATGSFDGLTVWDMQQRVEVTTLVASEARGWVRSACWSPDGSKLAVSYRDVSGRNEHEVVVWDTSDFSALWRKLTLADSMGWIDAMAWSPDGAHLAVVAPDRSIQIRDAGTGQTTSEHRARTHGAVSLQWSPDGSRLASGGGDGTVRVWIPGVPDAVIVLRGHTRGITTVRWSPDGTRLASAGNDRTIRIWDATRGYRWARSPAPLPLLNRRIPADSVDADALRTRADVYIHSGRREKAVVDLARWFRLQSGAPDATRSARQIGATAIKLLRAATEEEVSARIP